MGPGETQGTGTLYVVENGEYREFGRVSGLETDVTLSAEEASELSLLFLKDAEVSFTVDITSEWPEAIIEKMNHKCRSRKKFKKLLMSIGYSRNEAESYLCFAVPVYGSYRKAWKATVLSTVDWVF